MTPVSWNSFDFPNAFYLVTAELNSNTITGVKSVETDRLSAHEQHVRATMWKMKTQTNMEIGLKIFMYKMYYLQWFH